MISIFRFVVLCLLCAAFQAHADDPRAREIMQQVEDRDDGDNRTSDMRMVLIDRKGNQRTREIQSYAKDFGEDTYRMMFFREPADVLGTGFLTYDYDDESRDDDQWLYLPALRKVKRIASQDKSGSFMGSDFNYSDMTSRNLSDYDFTLQKELPLGEHTVWVIEAIPRSEDVIDETGYKKSLLLVRQDSHVVVRAVHWTADGNKQRYFDTLSLDLIDGIWTPLEVTMTTKQGKQTLHKTAISFSNVKYNQDLDESLFTVRYLERDL
ncbi:outer membrane lipoprotein-sorting protein [Seongchinamella unica]|uniref:Outer membrane lipoprotein-sorting protein n=1 Tax=Seongchinamella unica TaxID=2547392 RepID=A0A4R5LMW5_9GAMM|nr:outer membrane lipoprotein-sorting protein [Seongchinamella unica]TDG11388.1 outer membrane lipoprotein-sorting protein [Seongchinamella unica]